MSLDEKGLHEGDLADQWFAVRNPQHAVNAREDNLFRIDEEEYIHDILEQLGYDRLIFVGFNARDVISRLNEQSIDRGFRTCIVENAVSYGPSFIGTSDKNEVLQRAKSNGATVGNSIHVQNSINYIRLGIYDPD